MKKTLRILPLLLFIFLMDRFFFLPGRMDGTWEYEKGVYMGDPVSFDYNIEIVNNFEIKIKKNGKTESFYLLGCYFGNLYLKHVATSEYTVYTKLEEIKAVD